VNDTIGFEPNAVVALEGADGKVTCSGVLVTPLVALTAKSCVTPAKAGPRPRIRVGNNYDTATVYQSERDAVVYDRADGLYGELAIVFLDPSRPVLEEVEITREALRTPESLPSDDDDWEAYANFGVAGWSPFDATGGLRPGSASVRQQATREVMRFAYLDTQSLWVREVRNNDGALADGDLGGALFAVDRQTGKRHVVGIAASYGATPASLPGYCPPGAQRCDVWVNITTEAVMTWLREKLQITEAHRTPLWFSRHPRAQTFETNRTVIPNYWYGEGDYTGPCQRERDGDCDGWYDKNTDGSPRDNCPTWWNPDQSDTDNDGVGDVCDHCPAVANAGSVPTSPAWTQLNGAPVKGPERRYPAADESMYGRYPGDECRGRAVTYIEHVATIRAETADEGNPRKLVGAGGYKAVASNAVFDIKPRSLSGESLVGTTRLASCGCSLPDKHECLDTPSSACALKSSEDVTRAERWRLMTLANAADPSAPVSHGLLKTQFRAAAQSSPSQEAQLSWQYWNDLGDVLPAPAVSDKPLTVFRGIVSSWVKNFAPASEGVPADSVVTEPDNAIERLESTLVNLQELRLPGDEPGGWWGPGPEFDGLNLGVPQLDRWHSWVLPLDPFCPMCDFGSVVVLPRPGALINPGDMLLSDPIIRTANGGTLPATTLLSAESLHAIGAPGKQVVRAGDYGSTFNAGTVYGVTVDLASATVTNVFAGMPDGAVQMRSSAVSLDNSPVGTPGQPGQGTPPPPAPARTGFLPVELGTPDGPGVPPRVMVVSAARGRMYDFGSSWLAAATPSLSTIELNGGAKTLYPLRGTPLGTVVAAIYRNTDDRPYVLDLASPAGSRVARVGWIDARWRVRTIAEWPARGRAAYAMTTNGAGEITISIARDNGFAVIHGVIVDGGLATMRFEPRAVLVGNGAILVPATVRFSELALTRFVNGNAEARTLRLGDGVLPSGVQWLPPARVSEVF
jgi:hypothetical protein